MQAYTFFKRGLKLIGRSSASHAEGKRVPTRPTGIANIDNSGYKVRHSTQNHECVVPPLVVSGSFCQFLTTSFVFFVLNRPSFQSTLFPLLFFFLTSLVCVGPSGAALATPRAALPLALAQSRERPHACGRKPGAHAGGLRGAAQQAQLGVQHSRARPSQRGSKVHRGLGR